MARRAAKIEEKEFRQMTVVIPGKPRGKGRPRFSRQGKFVRTHTPEETASYENLVLLCAKQAMTSPWTPMVGPLHVEIDFVLPPTKDKKQRAGEWAFRKPDLDNMVKAVLDGLDKSGLWIDDAQVVSMLTRKFRGDDPRAEVFVRPIERPPGGVR